MMVKPWCNQLAALLAEKIDWIQMDLDSDLDTQNLYSLNILSCLVLWGEFSLVLHNDVDRIFREVRPTTSLLDPCPS